MDLITVLNLLKRKLWILLVFPSVSILVTYFLLSKMDKVYRSTAQIATGFTSDETVTLSDERTSNRFEIDTKFMNTMESMKSISVISLVSYELLLHDLNHPHPFRVIGDADNFEFTLNAETKETVRELLKNKLDSFKTLNSFDKKDQLAFSIMKAYGYHFDQLSGRFTIKRQNISDFITVDFESENPELSSFAANQLCQQFIRFNKTFKTDFSAESIEYLERIVEEKRKIRDERSAALSAFKISNNIFNYEAESTSKITQISTYEANRELVLQKISGLEFSLRKINSSIANFKKLDQAEIAKVNQRIIELRRNIDNLSSKQTEEARTQANQLRDELQFEIARLQQLNSVADAGNLGVLTAEGNRIELELQIARSNLSTIEDALANLKSSVTGLAIKEAGLSELERDLAAATIEFQDAEASYKAATRKASIIGSSLRQIIQAQPSKDPEASKGLLLAAFAGVSCFVFCAVGIVLVDLMNFSIRNQNRLERLTGIKNIATLNQIDLKLSDIQRVFQGKIKDENLDMFVHFIRKFRFEIENSQKQIFLIASTKGNVGKSFIIIWLAYTLSLLSKRILIIDTNFKSSSLTKLLIQNIDESTLLKKGADEKLTLLPRDTGERPDPKDIPSAPASDENASSLINRTQFVGVDIIGNYGGKESPSEIFAGKDFSRMLKSLIMKYDYILMEGPSLNDYSDTRELVGFADKVIPVFDAESILNELDNDSIKYIQSLNDKLMGTVLNKVKPKEMII